MEYVVGEILVWLLAALILGGVLAVLWMRTVMAGRGDARLVPLADRVAELEAERDLLRREVGEARDRSTERETQLSALRDDLEARDARIIAQAAEMERLREAGGKVASPTTGPEVEALKADLDDLRGHLAERDAQIAELNAELANAREAYHHLEAAQFGIAPVGPHTPTPANPEDDLAEALPEAEPPILSEAPPESADISEPPAEEPEPSPPATTEAQSKVQPAPEPVAPSPPTDTGGAGDDLTRIRGIGKVLEGKLKAMGVTSYAQIAAFSPDDVARFGAQITPKGRIERDGWIDQARTLLAEHETSVG